MKRWRARKDLCIDGLNERWNLGRKDLDVLLPVEHHGKCIV